MVDSPSPIIGIFDSGVGGLSVWREIVRQLPHAGTLYFADQAHVPYGPRSAEEILGFTRSITDFLLTQGAQIIVVACNTASGVALRPLRAAYPDVPFVGMEPAVKPAAEHTRNGRVGVIATPTTFQGALFKQLADRFGHDVEIHTQVCPGLVAAVEDGELDTPNTRLLLETCLAPLIGSGIDQLVLGCTHYPFLRPVIQQLVGPDVAVIDPAPAVARQTGRLLEERGLLHHRADPAHHTFFTSGSAAQLRGMARTLIGYEGEVTACTWHGTTLRTVD